MSLAKALHSELTTNLGVNNQIGTRVYTHKAPQDTALPFAVYEIDDSEHHYHMGGVSGLRKVTFGINTVAATFGAKEDAANAIRDALLASDITAGGTLGAGGSALAIQRLVLTGEHDGYGKVDDGDDQIRYWRIQDFECWHAESVPA